MFTDISWINAGAEAESYTLYAEWVQIISILNIYYEETNNATAMIKIYSINYEEPQQFYCYYFVAWQVC